MRYVPSSEEYFLIKPKVDMSWEELIRKMTLVGEPFLTVYRDIAGKTLVFGGYASRDYLVLLENPKGTITDIFQDARFVLGTRAYMKIDNQADEIILSACENPISGKYAISLRAGEFKVNLTSDLYQQLTKHGADFKITLFDGNIEGYVGIVEQSFSTQQFVFPQKVNIENNGYATLFSPIIVQINGLNTCAKPEIATVLEVENFPAELRSFKFSQNGVEIAPKWVSTQNKAVSIQAIPGKGDVRMHYVEAGICNYMYYNPMQNAGFDKANEIQNPLPCSGVASVYNPNISNGILIAKSENIKASTTIPAGTVRAMDLHNTQNQDYTLWVSGIRAESALTVLSASQQGNNKRCATHTASYASYWYNWNDNNEQSEPAFASYR
jgi:hypothetical protein